MGLTVASRVSKPSSSNFGLARGPGQLADSWLVSKGPCIKHTFVFPREGEDTHPLCLVPRRAKLHPMPTGGMWDQPQGIEGHLGPPPAPALADSVWPTLVAEISRWPTSKSGHRLGSVGKVGGHGREGRRTISGLLLDDVAVIVLKGHRIKDAFGTG